jgi:hypothetical protein
MTGFFLDSILHPSFANSFVDVHKKCAAPYAETAHLFGKNIAIYFII